MTQTLLATFALPFAVALTVALAAWFARARAAGAAVALGVAAGLLAGESAVAGWPSLPPAGAIDKLPWLALAGGLLGLATRSLAPRRRAVALGVGVAAALVWIGWPRLMVPHGEAWVTVALLAAAAIWALLRLEESGSAIGAGLLVVAAFAGAGIAVHGSSYAMAQVIAVLAAALAGAMAGAGFGGAGLGAAGRTAAALVLVGLLGILALYTRAAPLALALLLPVFLIDGAFRRFDDLAELAQRLGAGERGVRRAALVLGLALLPAGAAVGVAVWSSGPLYF